MIRYLLLPLIVLICSPLYSQTLELINSGEVIKQGVAAYDSGNYEAAIKAFMKVNPRDTNYVLMRAELAAAYNGAKEYEKAVEVVDDAIKAPSPFKTRFLKIKAIALDKMGKYKSSVELFESLLAKYPTDHTIVFNLGVTHYNNNDFERAKSCFFQVLTMNPYHAGSHINLGVISLNEGRKVHAMLSYGLYLIVNEKDNSRLVMLNNLLSNAVEDEGSVTPTGPNAFEKLDQIIRAKLAMEKNFKSSIPVDAAVVKQFELLFDQLDLCDKDIADPWVEFYIPIFRAIRERKHTVPFIYHMVSSANNDKVQAWNKKNDKSLKSFFSDANVEIKRRRLTPVLSEGAGIEKGIPGWYNDNGQLVALGRKNAEGNNSGRWLYFHSNGERSADGIFDNAGKKTGTWKYFNSSGIMTSEENEDTGEIIAFYQTGEKREHFFLKNGKTEGPVEIFYECGTLKEKVAYSNGQVEGEGTAYFSNGNKKTVYNYRNGKLDGPYSTYYEDGNLKSTYTNKEGKANGLYEEFYANGVLSKSGNYADDEQEGEWKYYYSNGKLDRTGTFVKSKGTGEWVYYNQKGELIERRNLKNGELQGEDNFYNNGKLHYRFVYNKDKLVGITYFDVNGKPLGDFANAKGNFSAKAFYTTGEQKSEGQLVGGELHGEWKYFYRHGKLSSKANYEKGLQQGESVEYYPSGVIKIKANYLDNKLHGYYQEFYEHGPVKFEGWYQNGERQQTFLAYTPQGKVDSDYYYLNDEPVGIAYEYHQGKMLSTVVYRNGVIDEMDNFGRKGVSLAGLKTDGPKKTYETKFGNRPLQAHIEILCGYYSGRLSRWYPDGKEFFSYDMVAGKRHGAYRYFGLENNLEMGGTYVLGEREGLWKGYNEEGNLDYIGRLQNGSYDSVWTYYYPNGKVSSTAEFFADERNGITAWFAPDGSPAVEKLYENGDLISFRTRTPQDSWSEWQAVSGNATITAFYPGGKKSIEEHYVDGRISGVKRVHYPDGKIYSEFEYKNGDSHGPFVVYHENGKVRRQGQYEYDNYEGVLKYYNPDGTLKRTEEYAEGVRSGKVVFYKKGVKSKEYNFWGGISDE